PDECNDMHGSPPDCVDSGNPGDPQENRLIGQGDAMVARLVGQITGAAFWTGGNNAIVITFDEGAEGDTSGCCDANPGSGRAAPAARGHGTAAWQGWPQVASPNAGGGDNALDAVSAGAADDIWAVGTQADDSSVFNLTLTEHFDGATWAVVPSPNRGPSTNAL